MPATGIEPVLYFYNRILSPARLPVPPRRQSSYEKMYCHLCSKAFTHELLINAFLPDNTMGRGGFEPPKQFAADLQSVPFGHSGICPFIRNVLTGIYYSIVNFNVQALFITMFSGNTRAPAPLSLSFPDRTCGYFPALFPPVHSRTVRPYDGISWQWSAPYVLPVRFHRHVCP